MTKRNGSRMMPVMPLDYVPVPTPVRTWGSVLQHCRRCAGMTLLDAEQLINAFMPTSDNALNRLEHLDAAPTQRRTRQLAVFALVAYSIEASGPYDPAEFGLDSSDIPSAYGDIVNLREAMRRVREEQTHPRP